jgi:predicted transcriptional regulator
LSRQDPQIAIRLPTELKDWLDHQARINGSSRTWEIVRSIRERIERAESLLNAKN